MTTEEFAQLDMDVKVLSSLIIEKAFDNEYSDVTRLMALISSASGVAATMVDNVEVPKDKVKFAEFLVHKFQGMADMFGHVVSGMSMEEAAIKGLHYGD